MTLPPELRYAHQDEQPMMVVRDPASGEEREWVDKRTYDRVVAALQWQLRRKQAE